MSIISQAVGKISGVMADRHMEKWCEQHRMNLNNGKRLVIGGLLVSEFGYLLRYYSNGALSSFENFQAIADAADGLVAQFEADFANPREYQNLNIGLSTAQANLKNLMMIVRTIAEYVNECNAQGCEARLAQGAKFNGN
ncbi:MULTISPECIES: hypothetical protein [Achromobacter]|uniref:Uncharacterized protein n=1 Tax=Achromobacter spanius TaxID=217203 RepID=A0AA42ITF9_9BURK|nr:hypothetical protein [Achromobacter spanius]MDH0734798.1 hypothetical protein [Achromobacter spanius]